MTHNSYLGALFVKVVIKYYNMSISENIQRIRQERGIPQAKVAELIGMERTNYFRLEKRGNKLTIEQLEKIGQALGVTVIELLRGEPEKAVDAEEVKKLKVRIEQLEGINESFFSMSKKEAVSWYSLENGMFIIFNDYMTTFGLTNGFFKESDYKQMLESTKNSIENEDSDLDMIDYLIESSSKLSVTNLMKEDQIILAIKGLDTVSREILELFSNKNLLIDKNLQAAVQKFEALSRVEEIAKQVNKGSQQT